MQLQLAFSLQPLSTHTVSSADPSILQFSIHSVLRQFTFLPHYFLQFSPILPSHFFFPVNSTNSPFLICLVIFSNCFPVPQISPFFISKSIPQIFLFPIACPAFLLLLLFLKAYQEMANPLQIASFYPVLSQSRKLKY